MANLSGFIGVLRNFEKKKACRCRQALKSCLYLDLSLSHNPSKLPVAGEDDDANGYG
jgi:hypothetical protein